MKSIRSTHLWLRPWIKPESRPARRLPLALAAALAGSAGLLAAAEPPPAFKTDQLPTRERFIEEAHPCSVSAIPSQGTPAGGVAWLPLDCLTVTTGAKKILPEAAGFSVSGPEEFSIHFTRPVFSIGIQCTVPQNSEGGVEVFLKQRSFSTAASVGVFHPGNANGGFFNVWSDTAFDSVEIKALKQGDLPVTWTQFYTGCLPRLKEPASFAGTQDKRYEFFRRTLATSASGPLGAEPRLPQPQGTNLEASGEYLHCGSIGIRGANGTSLRVGDKHLIDHLLPGHPVYDQTLGLLAGAEMASNSSTGEDFDVCPDAPVTAFGFDIVEVSEKLRENYPGDFPKFTGSEITQVASFFTITLFHGAQQVGDPFTFRPEDDVAAFWGVLSAKPFTRVEIRETEGGPDNELFGQFYTTPCGCCCGEKPDAK